MSNSDSRDFRAVKRDQIYHKKKLEANNSTKLEKGGDGQTNRHIKTNRYRESETNR